MTNHYSAKCVQVIYELNTYTLKPVHRSTSTRHKTIQNISKHIMITYSQCNWGNRTPGTIGNVGTKAPPEYLGNTTSSTGWFVFSWLTLLFSSSPPSLFETLAVIPVISCYFTGHLFWHPWWVFAFSFYWSSLSSDLKSESGLSNLLSFACGHYMTEAQSSRMLQRHVSNSCPIAMINATADDLQNLQQTWLSHSNIMRKILIELQFIFEKHVCWRRQLPIQFKKTSHHH